MTAPTGGVMNAISANTANITPNQIRSNPNDVNIGSTVDIVINIIGMGPMKQPKIM